MLAWKFPGGTKKNDNNQSLGICSIDRDLNPGQPGHEKIVAMNFGTFDTKTSEQFRCLFSPSLKKMTVNFFRHLYLLTKQHGMTFQKIVKFMLPDVKT